MWALDGWAFTCDPQLYEYNSVQSKFYCSTQQDCCTRTILRPPSYAKLCQPTIQPKQTNPQADLHTTLLRVISIVNIHWAAQEVRLSRWVSKSWNRYFMLLRSYPGHYILCFCSLFELKIFVLCLLSRSHTISNTYILPVGNTLYRKRHITRTTVSYTHLTLPTKA